MRQKVMGNGVWVLLLFGVLSCGKTEDDSNKGSNAQYKSEAVTVDIDVAIQEKVDITIDAVGSLEPAEEVDVSVQLAGHVKEILFEEGDSVNKDDLLITLDDDLLQLERNLAEKTLNRLKENLKRVEAALKIREAGLKRIAAEKRQAQVLTDNAKSNFQRKEKLFNQGAATEAVYLDAKAEFESNLAALDRVSASQEETLCNIQESQAAVQEAKKVVLEAEERVKIADQRLDDLKVRAPFAGVLGERYVGPGDFVDKGDGAVRLVAIDPIKSVFTVPEQYRTQVKIGQKVSITVEAVKQRTFLGEVVFIAPSLDVNTRSVKVKAIMENEDGLLSPGFFCHAKLILTSNPNAVVIPEQAIAPRGESFFVYVVEKNKAVLKEIFPGQRMAGKVEVKQGLKAGERVVVAGLQRVADGCEVRIREKAVKK